MKHFIDGSAEIVINYAPSVLFLDNNIIDWVDKPKDIANHRNEIKSIEILCQNNRNNENDFTKVYLTKEDIIKMADKIKDIEKDIFTAKYDELPW